MNTVLALIFLTLTAISGTGSRVPVVSQQETGKNASSQTQECVDERTRLNDFALVDEVFGFAFTREDWRMNVRDELDTLHMNFEWVPVNGAASIAAVDLLMWPCGYTEADVDAYYSDETIDILVSTWETSEMTAQCVVKGVRIYEFDLGREDGDYLARFWITEVDETRVVQGYMAVPVADASLLDDYAEVLYPDTPKCS